MPDPTTVFLVRHGHTDWIGNRIAGRAARRAPERRGPTRRRPGLVDRMRHLPLGAIYSSPLERTRETAAPLAERARMRRAGCARRRWSSISASGWGTPLRTSRATRGGTRSTASAACRARPAGELMPEVQTRIVAAIARIRAAHPGEAVAIFSHGDVIRVRRGVLRRRAARSLPAPRDQAGLHQPVRFFDESLQILAVNDTGEPLRARSGLRDSALTFRAPGGVRRRGAFESAGLAVRFPAPVHAAAPCRAEPSHAPRPKMPQAGRSVRTSDARGGSAPDPAASATAAGASRRASSTRAHGPRGRCHRGARGGRRRRGADAAPLGSFEYAKFGGTCRVEVFGLRVTCVHEHYDEERLRERRWFALADAVRRRGGRGRPSLRGSRR